MDPSAKTKTWSAFLTVLRRWAITMVVQCCINTSRALVTRNSDSASRADVASSRRRIVGFISIALAMATRCFCPPLNCTPRSPTWVSNFSGKFWINS
mmetsp:Transcript_4840/g.7183  ORF Transcript_4840/g.7183 Transcript_4840/m.7183 type:complete len:97 (-) Transcript_4840:1933-2223(-)